MRYFLFFGMTVIILSACKDLPAHGNERRIRFDTTVYDRFFGDREGGIIPSCIGCDCFKRELEARYSTQDSGFLKSLKIVADSNCARTGFPITHVRQATIDSLSDEIYNLTLVMRRDKVFRYRILEVKESRHTMDIIREFFDSDGSSVTLLTQSL